MDILKELFGTSDELQINKSLFGGDSGSSTVDLGLDNPPVSPSRDYLTNRPLPLLPVEPRQQLAVTSSLIRSQSLDNLHTQSSDVDGSVLRPDVLRAQSVFPQLSHPPSSNHVNLHTVVDEMPMYLLEEDEGNDEEIMRLLETSSPHTCQTPSLRNTPFSTTSSNQMTTVTVDTVPMEAVVVETEVEVVSEVTDQSGNREEVEVEMEVVEEVVTGEEEGDAISCSNSVTRTPSSSPPPLSSSSSSVTTASPPISTIAMGTTPPYPKLSTILPSSPPPPPICVPVSSTPLLPHHLRPSSLIFSSSQHLSLIPPRFHGNRGQSLSPPRSVFTPKPQLPPSLPLSPPLLSLPSSILAHPLPTLTPPQATPISLPSVPTVHGQAPPQATPTTMTVEQSIEQLKVQVHLQNQRLEEAIKSILTPPLHPPPPPPLPPPVIADLSLETSSASEERVNDIEGGSERVNTTNSDDGVKETVEELDKTETRDDHNIVENNLPVVMTTEPTTPPLSPVTMTTTPATPPQVREEATESLKAGIQPNKEGDIITADITPTVATIATSTIATVTPTTTTVEQFQPSFSVCVPESVCLPSSHHMTWPPFGGGGLRVMKALPIKILPPSSSSSSSTSSSSGRLVEGEMKTKQQITAGKKKRKRNGGGWPKGKKRKVATENDMPKPPSSAYSIFLSEQRQKLDSSNMTMSQLSKAVGRLWSDLSPQAKQEYQERSVKDRERYLHDIKSYLNKIQQEESSCNLESMNDVLNRLVAMGDDNNILFCHLCKLTFISLHNKQSHFASRSHSQCLLKEILSLRHTSGGGGPHSIPNGGMEHGMETSTTESGMESGPGPRGVTENNTEAVSIVNESGPVQSSNLSVQSEDRSEQTLEDHLLIDWTKKYTTLLTGFKDEAVAMTTPGTGGGMLEQFQKEEKQLMGQIDSLLSLLHSLSNSSSLPPSTSSSSSTSHSQS